MRRFWTAKVTRAVMVDVQRLVRGDRHGQGSPDTKTPERMSRSGVELAGLAG